jgi:hypothetical protein
MSCDNVVFTEFGKGGKMGDAIDVEGFDLLGELNEVLMFVGG